MGLASALAWLVTVVILAFVTLLLICVGPMTSSVGYRAIVDRLSSDDPKHPLVEGIWEERMMAAQQRRIVMAYIESYGIDANVGLTVGGLAGTIPAWYLSTYTGHWLVNLIPTVHH